jgi:hypothetical protein
MNTRPVDIDDRKNEVIRPDRVMNQLKETVIPSHQNATRSAYGRFKNKRPQGGGKKGGGQETRDGH